MLRVRVGRLFGARSAGASDLLHPREREKERERESRGFTRNYGPYLGVSGGARGTDSASPCAFLLPHPRWWSSILHGEHFPRTLMRGSPDGAVEPVCHRQEDTGPGCMTRVSDFTRKGLGLVTLKINDQHTRPESHWVGIP